VNVATVFPALKLTAPATLATRVLQRERDGAGHDGLEKVAVRATDTGTPVARQPASPATVGGAEVTALDGNESGPVPVALDADTVNVAVPFVSPDTVVGVASGVPVTVTGSAGRADEQRHGVPGELLPRCPSAPSGSPRRSRGGRHAGRCPGHVGALGTTALDAASPDRAVGFVADTLNVYVVPLVSPDRGEVAGGSVTVTGVCGRADVRRHGVL
jgi:hypothetical protein